jgi:hypothetical protein
MGLAPGVFKLLPLISAASPGVQAGEFGLDAGWTFPEAPFAN